VLSIRPLVVSGRVVSRLIKSGPVKAGEVAFVASSCVASSRGISGPAKGRRVVPFFSLRPPWWPWAVDAIVAAAVLILILQGALPSAVGGQLPKPSAIGEADGAAKRKANVDAAEAEAKRVASRQSANDLWGCPGFVAGLPRPGGNITGFISQEASLSCNQWERECQGALSIPLI
jgi:hypothetical protein